MWDARYTAWGDIKQGPNIGPGLQISQGTKNIKKSATIKEFNQISKWTQKYKKFSSTSLPALILENTMSVGSS